MIKVRRNLIQNKNAEGSETEEAAGGERECACLCKTRIRATNWPKS